MKNYDRRITWSVVAVAISFWVTLAWGYLSNQPESSFFVGPAVIAWGLTLVIDFVLIGVALVNVGYALYPKQITILRAFEKWLPLVFLVCISFYFEVQLDLHMHPFFRH